MNNTGLPLVFSIIMMLVVLVLIVSVCKVFAKAGKGWWAPLIPIYGNYCQFDITFGNGWMFLLMFIPVVNFVVAIAVSIKLATVFGKGIGFGIGLIFLPFIFLPILAFGGAEYIGV